MTTGRIEIDPVARADWTAHVGRTIELAADGVPIGRYRVISVGEERDRPDGPYRLYVWMVPAPR